MAGGDRMNLELITICVLLATSIALFVAMSIAWFCFGRHQYSLFWTLAAGGAMLQWTIAIIGRLAFPESPLPSIITTQLVVMNSSLIAIAFRQRAGLKPRIGLWVTGNLIVFAAVSYVVADLHDAAWRAFIANAGCGALFLVAVGALLSNGRRAQPMEIATAAVATVFALFELAVAGSALGFGSEGVAPAANTYRLVLGIGMPASYVALGISAVMLLVADLAHRLEALTTRDLETGALNRRGLDQAAVAAMANSRRRRLPLSVVLIDLHGVRAQRGGPPRAVLNQLLVGAADQLNALIREEDVFARLGPTRFCLLLGDTRLQQALVIARQAGAAVAASAAAGRSLKISWGVAQLRSEDFAFSLLLDRAEREMAGENGSDSTVARIRIAA